MDIYDQAQELEMFEREHRIAETLRSGPVIPAKGYCLFCDYEVPYSHRWCDADCCRDWEAMQEGQRRNGFKSDEED